MSLGERILVIVSERVGDVVFCTPAISLLRASKPHSTIDVLALSPAAAQVLEHNPAVDELLVAPHKRLVKHMSARYTSVIDLHNSKKTAPYVKWLNRPTVTSPRVGQKHQSLVATDVVRTTVRDFPMDHPDEYRLYPQSADFERAKALLLESAATLTAAETLIGCHMGCSKTVSRLQRFWTRTAASTKTWPVEKFVALQKLLQKERPHCRLVLTGTPAESKLGKYFHGTTVCNLIGKTSVLELTAMMKYFKAFLTGDTGPMHLAAATNLPIVALFGPTTVETTGPHPLRDHHTILQCNPLSDLPVETVYRALLRVL